MLDTPTFARFVFAIIDALDYNLIKSKKTETSEYGELSTYYTYLHGDGHYLPYAETEVILCGNTIVSAKRTEYDKNTRQPLRTYEISNTADTTGLVSKNQATTERQIAVINEKAFEYIYNDNGNIIEIRYKDRPLASYLWGYYGLYPIVEAIGIGHERLQSEAITAGLTNDEICNSTVRTQSDIIELSGKLRSQMPGVSISSLAYHWLLGIIEMSDSRGISTHYSYDRAGRLSEIRDFNKYLIQKFEYHYANQYEDESPE